MRWWRLGSVSLRYVRELHADLPEGPTISNVSTIAFRAPMRPKTGESERNVSPCETKRFAFLVLRHWNYSEH